MRQERIEMDLGIKGKTALVLSAGGGLGRAIAIAMAREGASVALADIDECALERTLAEVEAAGTRAIAEKADLMDLATLNSFVARIERELGTVEILINIPGGRPRRLQRTCRRNNGEKNFKLWLSP